MEYLYLLSGVVLLLLGGDFLVRAAVELALRMKISVLVVGMTVVSFATSAPELLVSLKAAFDGYSDISLGNVIGSNIANISLILGLTAMLLPISVKRTTYQVDWWIMMGATLMLYLFIAFDGAIVFHEGVLMVLALIWFNVFQIRSSRKKNKQAATAPVPQQEEEPSGRMHIGLALFFLLGGVAALKFGSDFLVSGAVDLAQKWNVSERVIGLTIVSLGTSLPELAASVIASLKGEQELSLGNLIGSNIFNILAVLGFTGLVIDIPVKNQALLAFDFPALFFISLLLYPFMVFFTKGRISRAEGLILFGCFTLYTVLLFV